MRVRRAHYFWSSLSRSESWPPCCIALLTSVVTLSIVFFGCSPARLEASFSAEKSHPGRPTTSEIASKTALVRGSVDKAVPPDPGHHFAQPRADLLDRKLGGHAPLAGQPGRGGAAPEDETLRVLR